MLLARVRISGEVAGLLIYFAIISIIGGALTSITEFIRKKFTKNDVKTKKIFKWIDRLIWFALIIYVVLDIYLSFS